MDYQKLLEEHRNNKADITVAVLDNMKVENTGFGSFKIDVNSNNNNNNNNRVIGFTEEQELFTSLPVK